MQEFGSKIKCDEHQQFDSFVLGVSVFCFRGVLADKFYQALQKALQGPVDAERKAD